MPCGPTTDGRKPRDCRLFGPAICPGINCGCPGAMRFAGARVLCDRGERPQRCSGNSTQRMRWVGLPRVVERRLSPQIGRATSELQSHLNLVCRLLLEKKKQPRTDRQT